MQDATRSCAYPDNRAGTGYQYGCRCDRCRDGWAADQRKYRSRAAGLLVILCECGTPLPHGNSKHCSEACKRLRQPNQPRVFTCARTNCQNICMSEHPYAKFCSDRCRNYVKTMAKVAKSPRLCPCGVTFMVKAPSSRRIYCSPGCSTLPVLGPSLESWPMFVPTKRPPDRPCVDCGGMMVDAANTRKRCTECARRHNISKIMGLYDVAVKLIAASPHAERSAHMKRAMRWRYELVEYLRERDGDKCALCSKRMLFDVTTGPRGGSDKGATVDHVLPRSHGGSNDLSNLQLAHWSCNRSKSNRGAAEQLRLVG